MPEASFLLEVVKVIGFPAVIFAIWYIDHKSQERKHEDTKALFLSLINNMEKNAQQSFDLLKEMLETNTYHGGMLIKIEEHLRTSQYCPLMRKEFKQNEYRNASA